MFPQAVDRLQTQVAALMTRHPITVSPCETVETAAKLLRLCHIRHLPVVRRPATAAREREAGGDDEALVGVVSLRDVVAADSDTLVASVMSAPAETTAPDVGVEAAVGRLLGRRISCLPVVDGQRLIGIFTATDALRFALAALDEEATELRRQSEVARFMTARPLVTVAPTATLASAWQTMKAGGVRHLPVMQAEQLIGILSDRDILATGRAWLDGSADGGAILVADAMSARVTTVAAERPASEAARILLRRRVGAVPVLRGHGLIGILTVSDFLYWIVARG